MNLYDNEIRELTRLLQEICRIDNQQVRKKHRIYNLSRKATLILRKAEKRETDNLFNQT